MPDVVGLVLGVVSDEQPASTSAEADAIAAKARMVDFFTTFPFRWEEPSKDSADDLQWSTRHLP